jgi:hypothetical protein
MESQVVPGQWYMPDAPWDRIRQRGVEEGWLPASFSPGYVIPQQVLDAHISQTFLTYASALQAAVAGGPTTGPPSWSEGGP